MNEVGSTRRRQPAADGSALNLSRVFTYQVGGIITALSPTETYQTLWLNISGSNFSSSAVAYFGSSAATQTKRLSLSDLEVQVPDGSGEIGVTVHEAGVISNSEDFQYLNPLPVVTTVAPSVGPAGSTVVIAGNGFTSYSTVKFGTTAAASVTYVSSTELKAKSPVGSGTVNVLVSQFGVTAVVSCDDHFTYGSFLPAGSPIVYCVSPGNGPTSTVLTIYGANLTPNPTVLFGGMPATNVSSASGFEIFAGAPLGNATVPILVETANGTSPLIPQDLFGLTYGSHQVRGSVELPEAISAAPLDSLQVVASAAGSAEITLYNISGSSYKSYALCPFNTSIGSPILDQIGGTSLYSGNGTPGQLAVADSPIGWFVLFTSDSGGRTIIETMTSTTGGVSWTGPYLTGPALGSVSDPAVATSPVGYFFATWRETGSGPWQVDQAVFGSSGQVLQTPEAIVGSGGAAGFSAGPPSVAVDGLNRPIYLWAESASGNNSPFALGYSGAFLSPANELQQIQEGATAAAAADFMNFGAGSLPLFRRHITANIGWVQSNLTGSPLTTALCKAAEAAYGHLYANVTWDSWVLPLEWGPSITPTCSFAKGSATWTGLANTTGAFSPNVYLWDQTESLMESLGIGAFPAPAAFPNLLYPLTNPQPATTLYAQDVGDYVTDTRGDAISIQAVTLSPAAVWLNVSGSFVSNSSQSPSTCGFTTLTDTPSRYWVNVTDTSSGYSPSSGSYSSWSSLPSVFLTELAPLDHSGTWSAEVQVQFNATTSTINTCTGNRSGPLNVLPHGWPRVVSNSLSGTFVTGLSPYPWSLGLSVQPAAGSDDRVALWWNNTMLAKAGAWVNGTGSNPGSGGGSGTNIASWADRNYSTPENVSGSKFSEVPAGSNSTIAILLRSGGGGDNSSWQPQLNNQQYAGNVGIVAQIACSFTPMANPTKMWWNSKGAVSNITATSATVTWNSTSTSRGLGWVSFNASNGWADSQSAQSIQNPINHTWEYVVELHGLLSWSIMNVTAHTKIVQGTDCYSGLPVSVSLVYSSASPVWWFATQAVPAIMELDAPYDSVSQQGGGASIYWQVPTVFTWSSEFNNGSLTLTNTSGSDVVPLLAPLAGYQGVPKGWWPDGFSSTYVENLTALSPNTTYSAVLELNYTLVAGPMTGHSITALTQPYNFTYERDTSGDGLTDAEKVAGWNVTDLEASGAIYSFKVTANPNEYATNGLVSDFVEKELDLNPARIDTSGSHMLDTWNLTFDLGAGSPALPATGFEYWYENSTYQFNQSCPVPQQAACSFAPIDPNASNLTATGRHNPGGDDSPWGAQVLWSGEGQSSALAKLEQLIRSENEGWLRAVTGTYDGNRTITVWGKLSWGANPLSSSTLGTGIPDGYLVDPVGETSVQIEVSAWSDSGLRSGNGVAAFIEANSAAAPYYPVAREAYANYTSQTSAGSGGSTSYSGTFVVTVPVIPTEQTAQLNFTLVQNVGVNGNNIFESGLQTGTVNVNLTSNAKFTRTFTNSSKSSLTVEWQSLAISSKGPTLIAVPGNNSTLSNLPWGLRRYVGEQDFVLLVMNDTVNGSAPTRSGLRYPGNTSGTYSASLQPGLNNLLVPRSVFLGSPLGQALLNGSNESIRSTSTDSSLQPYWVPNEWYARITGTSWGGVSYAPPSSGYVRVYSSTNQGCTNSKLCGGVPSEPGLEQGSEGFAIDAIFALNITSYSDWNSTIAGLVLDSAGEFNDWLLSATAALVTLALTSTVNRALANATEPNSGGYGSPTSSTSTQQSSPAPCSSILGGQIWNGVSGVGNWIAGGIGEGFSVAWNGAKAGFIFIMDLPAVIGGWSLYGITQAISGLRQIYNDILSIFNTVVQNTLNLISGLIRTVVQEVKQGIQNYLGSVASNAISLLGEFTGSSFSLSSTLEAYGSLLLSLIGLSSFLEDISIALSEAGSLLRPVQSLVSTSTLTSTISLAMGTGLTPAATSSAQQGLASLGTASFGAVSNVALGMLSQLGSPHSTTSYVTTSPHPSSAQLGAAVSDLGQDSGQQGYSSNFGNDFSWTSSLPETILDGAHVGLAAGVIAMTLLSAIGEVWGGVDITFQNLVTSYAPAVESSNHNPAVTILLEVLACLLSVSSLWWPSPPSDSVINEVMAVSGAMLAWTAFAYGAVTAPEDENTLTGTVELVAAVVATIPPFYVWYYG